MKKNKHITKIKASFRKMKMTLNKVLIERYKSLSLVNRIQFVAAVIVTLTALIAVPVYAWLTHQRTLAEMQRIKSPDLLYITAANAEAVKNLDMSAIDVEAKVGNTPVTHKMIPFCVAGDYVSSFTLQLLIPATIRSSMRFTKEQFILPKKLQLIPVRSMWNTWLHMILTESVFPD